jgi:hypothetical protein
MDRVRVRPGKTGRRPRSRSRASGAFSRGRRRGGVLVRTEKGGINERRWSPDGSRISRSMMTARKTDGRGRKRRRSSGDAPRPSTRRFAEDPALRGARETTDAMPASGPLKGADARRAERSATWGKTRAASNWSAGRTVHRLPPMHQPQPYVDELAALRTSPSWPSEAAPCAPWWPSGAAESQPLLFPPTDALWASPFSDEPAGPGLRVPLRRWCPATGVPPRTLAVTPRLQRRPDRSSDWSADGGRG